jgi:hypothetical protein
MIDHNNPMYEVCEYYHRRDKDKNLGYNSAWISKDTEDKYHYSMKGPKDLPGETIHIDTTRWDRERMEFWGNINWKFVGELYEKGLKDKKRTNNYGKTRTSGSCGRLQELAGSSSSRS